MGFLVPVYGLLEDEQAEDDGNGSGEPCGRSRRREQKRGKRDDAHGRKRSLGRDYSRRMCSSHGGWDARKLVDEITLSREDYPIRVFSGSDWLVE